MEATSASTSVLPSLKKDQTSADKFYRELDDKHLAFKFQEDELDELGAAVHEIVLAILKRLETIDDKFKCQDVISVGSFKEGTKILQPNEFDFLAVIDELSQPNAVEPVRVCKERRGFVHLNVKDKILQKRWQDYIDNGELLSFATNPPKTCKNPESASVSFSSLIQSVYMQTEPIVISKSSGTLKFAGVSIFLEPNTVVILAWKSKHQDNIFKITADLSPAVRCHNVTMAITPDDCPYKHLYTEVQNCGSFLLIPGKSRKNLSKCFHISVIEVEVSLVQSFGETHKICYRVLKYILGHLCGSLDISGGIYKSLSSYILKSAVLHHAADGQCNSDSVDACMEPVLYSLLNCLMKNRPHLPFMPSVFIRDHNLFKDLVTYQTSKDSATRLIMHVQCLMSVLFFHQKLRTLPVFEYDYEECMKTLEHLTQQLDKANRNATKLAKQFCDDEGKWKAIDMSTNDLLRKFGVPYKIVKDDVNE